MMVHSFLQMTSIARVLSRADEFVYGIRADHDRCNREQVQPSGSDFTG